MLVHPATARLRSKGASQPQIDTALAAWRALLQVAAVLEALADYGAGAPLADDSALAGLLADHAAAAGLVAGFIDPFMQALRAEPLAQLPLGFSAKPGLARIRLAESGRAALSLAVFAPCAPVRAASVLFQDGAAHALVLAGAGEAARFRPGAKGLTREADALWPAGELSGSRMVAGAALQKRTALAAS